MIDCHFNIRMQSFTNTFKAPQVCFFLVRKHSFIPAEKYVSLQLKLRCGAKRNDLHLSDIRTSLPNIVSGVIAAKILDSNTDIWLLRRKRYSQ
jgi:hypothetical protein